MYITTAGECRDDEVEEDDGPGMLKVGTLEQLYTAADKRVLLCLSLPLGATGLVDTPRLQFVILVCCFVSDSHHHANRDLSSDSWAWLQTNGRAGFRQLAYLSDDTRWGTVGTAGSTSHLHLDDAGLCTSTQVLTGKKYWVAFYRDPALEKKNPAGDLGTIEWSPSFEDLYNHNVKGFLTAEAIEMGPGTILWVSLSSCHSFLICDWSSGSKGQIHPTMCILWSTPSLKASIII